MFVYYPLLPFELRMRIISFLLPPHSQERLVELRSECYLNRNYTSCPAAKVPTGYEILKDLVRINSEIRGYVSKSWISIWNVWINIGKDGDVLYLLDPASLRAHPGGREDHDCPNYLNLERTTYQFSLSNRDAMRKIKRLALTYYTWRKNKKFGTLQELARFENLEEVTVIFNAGTKTGMESNASGNEGDWLNHVRMGETERTRYLSMVEREVEADARGLRWGGTRTPRVLVKEDQSALEKDLARSESRELLRGLLGIR